MTIDCAASGTTIRFLPDPEIFEETAFDYDTLSTRFRETAFLTPGLRITLTDERGSIYFRGTKTIDVTRDSRWAGKKTFYVEHGDWFVLVCTLLLAGTYFLLMQPKPAAVSVTGPESQGS